MNMVFVSLFCFLAFSSRTSNSVEPKESSEGNKDKIVRIPTLGRPALLGELYSAHADIFIPGFSPWSPDQIKNGTRKVWNPSSHTKFSADESNEDKHTKLDITAALAGSFEGGLVKVSGSAAYLDDNDDKEKTASVTLSFMSIARTESLSSTLLKPAKSSPICNDLKNIFTDKSNQPTHVVASVTYGGDCHMVFKRALSDTDDKKHIHGELKIFVQAATFSISGQADVTLDNNSTDLSENITVTLYPDFLLSEQPLSFEDAKMIYRDISQNFGTKDSNYDHSVPKFVTLIPIKSFCHQTYSLAEEIGKDILKQATNVRLTLMKVLDKISKLLTSRAAVGNFFVRELLLGFQSDVSKFTLNYEAELQRIIIGARNPNITTVNESQLVELIKNYTSSLFDYDTHLYTYLGERNRQVNALNIFYTQTVMQDVPQIASYTKADVPAALITEPVLFLLTLYVLPNVSAYNYTKWANSSKYIKEKNEGETRWYNNYTTVGQIGNIWRDFRNFYYLNGYKEGQNFFVVLKKEEKEKKEEMMPMNLTLYVDGINTTKPFELRELLNLKTNPQVCRTSKGANLSIKVDNPPQWVAPRPPPNTIKQVLVSITNTQSVFKEPIDHTSSFTTITIPNLVPEYTYNVTVAYVTEFGSLTPSRIYTRLGFFDEMEKTVGCKISRNMMKKDITMTHKSIGKLSASDCAAECHTNTTCSDGWTFQLATGNCYFNKPGTNSTQMSGWAVGTQSCQAVKIFEDDCRWSVLFLDAHNIIDLPSFKKRDCSLRLYPGNNHGHDAVSGMLGGNLITCGGADTSETFKTCFCLENGKWVKKPDISSPSADVASSPDPKNPNGLMISGGWNYTNGGDATTETLTPGGQSWIPGLPVPGELYQHCQVTLGTTVIITGGNNGNGDTGTKRAFKLVEDSTKWLPLPDMNQTHYDHSCAVLDNTVYVMGGYSLTAEKFKLGWDKWETIQDVPSTMGWSKPAFVYENKLYIITDNGSVYSLKDGSSWEYVVDIEQYKNVNKPTWPSQVLTASSIGC